MIVTETNSDIITIVKGSKEVSKEVSEEVKKEGRELGDQNPYHPREQ